MTNTTIREDLERNLNETQKVEKYVKLAHVLIGTCLLFVGFLGTIAVFWYGEQKETVKEISQIKQDVVSVKGSMNTLTTKIDFLKEDISYIKKNMTLTISKNEKSEPRYLYEEVR